ncbi:small multidrug resistance pump [Clostridium saccharoperbutylacetonicum]|uniref:Membrane transporters of cations and cationic drugs n=1 Tax=Clostridium saccharoperbutylacetonicum N1-4(HMT) TaxID=931276 RepID=M1MDG2_9CLOT|nr:multidrug efflux SMR transporter [Clostridium saccharoperbutylacetonicum]AGF55964.1 membrane transporters of cations and cationic drugs [Clostridium saccharoperbutylacetonicum N1-4(HMT)]NRT63297.1 small multidrug resistance pump [Clostridium saccharoperbutylacetonicum]NSB26659.1 small multidrug resistance pump [Clostridium saccharoperbutylacetonicum]NSB46009.1 small multidrug resistance pump [Clostridium saccharoperbutylacetonicum]
MSWIYLILAITFEILGTTLMKLSDGFSNVKYAIAMLIFYVLSLSMLTLALKKLEIGIAYAIWSGVGIVLLSIIGVIFFKESINLPRIIFVSFILIGTIGLNLSR